MRNDLNLCVDSNNALLKLKCIDDGFFGDVKWRTRGCGLGGALHTLRPLFTLQHCRARSVTKLKVNFTTHRGLEDPIPTSNFHYHTSGDISMRGDAQKDYRQPNRCSGQDKQGS